ncbi:glycosyltransferase family 2 protein [Sandaracinus amylolyticus]|uniref:Glycosyl transferase, family 2 n=1 Tax=Sandaracinus amylolyticus TaxID=927083 RepID=A0A0F6W7J3_9BACT|nr:glycosyltransferase family 2 protein [Sandaracinus amylolyticus]AKF09430.1 Glycosyl transferase, family 2 precursor [Sandaracinus amylolyticus]
MFFTSLGLAGTALTLPGTLELAALTLGSVLPREPRRADPARCGKLAVVVPAHDEEGGIAACVHSLLACDAPPNGARILVIADNCSDATAERARDAGAEVLERNDRANRGKGFALEMAFAHVLADPEIEAVLVVDADTEVAPGFLVAMAAAFAGGADGVQSRYLVANPEAGPKARLMNVAFLAFNVARPRARERFGLSVGILGNGFGLHRRVLDELPYTARSVVEDLEYHLMLVRKGFAIRFVEETFVRADMPTSEEGIDTQRARWEGGRFRMIREHVPALLRDVLAGNRTMLEPLGELLLLPLATHVGTLLCVLVIPFPPTQLYAAGALGLVGAHVLSALYVGGGTAEDVSALARAPLYVAQKAMKLPSLLRASRKDQAWIRTARDPRPAATAG